MRAIVSWTLGVFLTGFLAGCDRHPASPHAVRPATAPAATRPAVSFISIDMQTVEFPPARLRLEKTGSGVVARLFSDDPPAVIHDDYAGNFYYLQMPLNIPDPDRLDTASWRYQASPGRLRDTRSGIFLKGGKKQLQPFDLHVQFQRQNDWTLVWLDGQFVNGDKPDAPPVPVAARFRVHPEMKQPRQ